MKKKGCNGLIKKLNTFDWLCDLTEAQEATDWVEVQFKNTRKGYYLNSNKISLEKGDIVAVESSPGHDIGEVTLTGALVLKQMKKNNYRFDQQEVRRIYRKARPIDLEKYEESKALEHETMLKSRKIAEDLQLNMKIGDVEYQGDGNKAIFYYIADDRVDFRQLIKVLAETFHIRIEMKQIGARQEAGRIGGVGPCGRELCCSSWITNFVSVSTSAARYQDLSLNPQKLAGQCAKLKCCLNYETDVYVEAQRDIPSKEIVLETKESSFFLFKADIFKRMLTYSTSKDILANAVTIPVERAKIIIALNKKGIRVDSLSEVIEVVKKNEFGDVLSQDGLTRFDHSKKSSKNKGNKDNRRPERAGNIEKQNKPEITNKGEKPENTKDSNAPVKSKKSGNSLHFNNQKRHLNEVPKTGKELKSNEGNHQDRPERGNKKYRDDSREMNQKGDHNKNRVRFEKPQKPTPSNGEISKDETK
jgi:cell fate regulator YaaT (PSP1 superfamily)